MALSKVRQRMMEYARHQIGVRYWTMHCGPKGSDEEGYGCAMLAMDVHNVILGTDYYGSCWSIWGEAIGAQVYNQGGTGEFFEVDNPLPGDVVLYFESEATYASTLARHAAVYAGDGMVIGSWGKNAPGDPDYYPGRGVSYDRLEDQSIGGTWRFVRCKRVVEAEEAEEAEKEKESHTEPESESTQTEDEMFCIIHPNDADYLAYFDGQHIHPLGHPDEAEALDMVYAATHDGKKMPRLKLGSKKAPWATRLMNVLNRTTNAI